jgi:hypothetical protein
LDWDNVVAPTAAVSIPCIGSGTRRAKDNFTATTKCFLVLEAACFKSLERGIVIRRNSLAVLLLNREILGGQVLAA